MIFTKTQVAFAAYFLSLAVAERQTFIVQLVDNTNIPSLQAQTDNQLLKDIEPHVKETISIGSFSCLVAELESTEAVSISRNPLVKKVTSNAAMMAEDLPLTDPLFETNTDQLFQVQIEDPERLLKNAAPDAPQAVTPAPTQAPVPTLAETPLKSPMAAATVQENAPLHLARITRREGLWDVSNSFTYDQPNTGAGVYAYILDTGIAIDHPELEGRAIRGKNCIATEMEGDFYGHGTHVAGIIGSKTYGVAKEATLVDVKVLGGSGGGTVSGILLGMEWAAKDRTEKGVKGVMNMSLGGFYNSIVNDAVDAVVRTGMVVVVAAGNEGTTTSLFSPSSAPLLITVGAMDLKQDTIASFSNFGEKVDVFAPGFEVESLNAKNYEAPILYSGTSMASPVAAGVLALYLQEGIPQENILATFAERSTKKALNKSLRRSWKFYSTKDRLVYAGADLSQDSVKLPSPYAGVDLASMTALPSFGSLLGHDDITQKRLSYTVY